jgi:hypothetical protein
MDSLSSHSVVEQMTSELAERRRDRTGRNAAYLSLARAILSNREPRDRTSVDSAFERHLSLIERSPLAA